MTMRHPILNSIEFKLKNSIFSRRYSIYDLELFFRDRMNDFKLETKKNIRMKIQKLTHARTRTHTYIHQRMGWTRAVTVFSHFAIYRWSIVWTTQLVHCVIWLNRPFRWHLEFKTMLHLIYVNVGFAFDRPYCAHVCVSLNIIYSFLFRITFCFLFLFCADDALLYIHIYRIDSHLATLNPIISIQLIKWSAQVKRTNGF